MDRVNLSVFSGIRNSATQPLSTMRAHVPDAVPVCVALASLVRHLGIPLYASRVGRELEPVTLVGKRIDHHEERIAGGRVEVFLLRSLTTSDPGESSCANTPRYNASSS